MTPTKTGWHWLKWVEDSPWVCKLVRDSKEVWETGHRSAPSGLVFNHHGLWWQVSEAFAWGPRLEPPKEET